MPMPTLLGALRRTDLLPSDPACVAAATKAQNATSYVLEAGGSSTPAPDVPTQHATQDKPAAPEPSLFGLEDASVFVAAKHTPEPPPPVFDTARYLKESSGLYRLSQGVSFAHRDKLVKASRVLYDTCSEVNLLLSKEFADKHGILYGPSPHKIHTSMGRSSGVVGQVVGPIHTILNQ
eukprot:723837-Pelagomonas_calceolata.AAC.1